MSRIALPEVDIIPSTYRQARRGRRDCVQDQVKNRLEERGVR